MFSKRFYMYSNSLLGKKLRGYTGQADRCFICKNLLENLGHFLNMMLEESKSYTFASFSVGAIIKPSIVDRDDLIRSRFKLRGPDSVKTGITKELCRQFSKKMKKSVDHLDSDVTFTVNIKDESCEIRSKFITVSGRYIKSERGLSQKQEPCENCLGKGCRICCFHGITKHDSVEGVISLFLFKKFGGTTIKFSWIGGEDESSLVLGKGRPFFAKINNPFKRKARLPDVTFGSVKLRCMQMARESPKIPLKFRYTAILKISAESPINPNDLKKLDDIQNGPVVVYEKSGKRSEKKVSCTRSKIGPENSLILEIAAEGGLSIKRFVSGDNVTPSVSQLLGNRCVCMEFDFLDIDV